MQVEEEQQPLFIYLFNVYMYITKKVMLHLGPKCIVFRVEAACSGLSEQATGPAGGGGGGTLVPCSS